MRRHEWDWPPERRQPDILPPVTGWASPAVTHITSIYWRTVMTILKTIVGAIGGLVIAGCVWLAVAILNH